MGSRGASRGGLALAGTCADWGFSQGPLPAAGGSGDCREVLGASASVLEAVRDPQVSPAGRGNTERGGGQLPSSCLDGEAAATAGWPASPLTPLTLGMTRLGSGGPLSPLEVREAPLGLWARIPLKGREPMGREGLVALAAALDAALLEAGAPLPPLALPATACCGLGREEGGEEQREVGEQERGEDGRRGEEAQEGEDGGLEERGEVGGLQEGIGAGGLLEAWSAAEQVREGLVEWRCCNPWRRM